MFPSTGSVTLEGPSCGPPHRLIEFPVDVNGGFPEEGIQKGFGTARYSHQLSKDRSRGDEGSALQSGVQGRLCGGTELRVTVPESNNDIGVEGGGHRPRKSRTQRITSLRPDASPGLPIPLNFANGLFVLTGRTRIPFSSPSNIRRSPGRTPSTRRTSRGTVICPLLVIFACFTKVPHLLIPYIITRLLTLSLNVTEIAAVRARRRGWGRRWSLVPDSALTAVPGRSRAGR